jgi:hypothetical protein
MRKSHIEIRKAGSKDVLVAANYLTGMVAASREQREQDPDACWVAQFHPLVARSIDQLAYRQFNYATLMALPTQLARWLHKQLSIKFTFASMLGNPFEMHYSTTKRDSNLLNRGRERGGGSAESSRAAALWRLPRGVRPGARPGWPGCASGRRPGWDFRPPAAAPGTRRLVCGCRCSWPGSFCVGAGLWHRCKTVAAAGGFWFIIGHGWPPPLGAWLKVTTKGATLGG